MANTSRRPAPEPAQEYTRAELLAKAQAVFGQPRFVVAGAFYGSDEPVTLDEAKKLVEDFLKREVK